VTATPLHWTRGEPSEYRWNLAASLDAFERQTALTDGIKTREDLDRYAHVIERTCPLLLIETGTWLGASARWFAGRVPEVWTIDCATHPERWEGNVAFIAADSSDPDLLRRFRPMVRTMIVLDADHHTEHVARELVLWAPFVTPGCYLVVEDTILRYVKDDPDMARIYEGQDPLAAVEAFLTTDEGQHFVQDRNVEGMFAAGQFPGGWLKRVD
jgi:cephalosporin hydroxylase